MSEIVMIAAMELCENNDRLRNRIWDHPISLHIA